ncbi:MAG TPA: hypothetical protein VJZ71_20535 [Phycisphaerae bacterium]|nr:hypothetical protein [Phycisphaerae bacterium]
MHDLPLTNASAGRDTHSTIYEKTTADERRKVDRAIVNRDPPTYRGVFEKFRLAEKGVSFTAFYNYARRIRAAAQVCNLAELVAPAQADLNQTLPRLLGDRLIETLLYQEDATPAQIQRLTLAYASAITTAIKAHKACDVFPRRRPVAAAVPAADEFRAAASEPPSPRGAELSTNTVDAPSPRADSAPQSLALVDPVPSVPEVPLVPSVTSPPPIPHSAIRIPTLPNSLVPRIDLDDLPDPDPRREALRQRIREDLTPLLNIPDSS